MWTFRFFLSLVKNTGPVDGSFAQSYTTGVILFPTFARLAVTARARSSLRSSFIVELECGCFSLFFCAEASAACVHLREKTRPSPFTQYSRAKCVQYLLPSTRDACGKPHTLGMGGRGGGVGSQQQIEEANKSQGNRKGA